MCHSLRGNENKQINTYKETNKWWDMPWRYHCQLCGNNIDFTVTKNGSLILSDKTICCSRTFTALIQPARFCRDENFWSAFLLQITPAKSLCEICAPHLSSPVMCAGVQTLQLSLLLTRLSQSGRGEKRRKKKGERMKTENWRHLLPTEQQVSMHRNTLKNSLMSF